jgi:hypothetical protein
MMKELEDFGWQYFDVAIRGLISFAISFAIFWVLKKYTHLTYSYIIVISFLLLIGISLVLSKILKKNMGFALRDKYYRWIDKMMKKEKKVEPIIEDAIKIPQEIEGGEGEFITLDELKEKIKEKEQYSYKDELFPKAFNSPLQMKPIIDENVDEDLNKPIVDEVSDDYDRENKEEVDLHFLMDEGTFQGTIAEQKKLLHSQQVKSIRKDVQIQEQPKVVQEEKMHLPSVDVANKYDGSADANIQEQVSDALFSIEEPILEKKTSIKEKTLDDGVREGDRDFVVSSLQKDKGISDKGQGGIASTNSIPSVSKNFNLEHTTELDKDSYNLCPKCKGKLKEKGKVIENKDGKFCVISLRCRNTGRKWIRFWRKPTCDYWDELIERID